MHLIFCILTLSVVFSFSAYGNTMLEKCANEGFRHIDPQWSSSANQISEWFSYCSKWNNYPLEYMWGGCEPSLFGTDYSEQSVNSSYTIHLWQIYEKNVSEQETFIYSKLNKKLKNRGYEAIFKSCETELKDFPETFKARWD